MISYRFAFVGREYGTKENDREAGRRRAGTCLPFRQSKPETPVDLEDSYVVHPSTNRQGAVAAKHKEWFSPASLFEDTAASRISKTTTISK